MITLLKGFVIGLANIIPGVSGGTLALILGIYERVINALHSVGTPLFRALLNAVLFRPNAGARLREELRRVDAGFLGLLGLGAVAAILATSHLMAYLLERQHAPAYAFFFGLVLASIGFPYRYIRRKSWRELLAFLLAAALTVAMTFMVSDASRIEKARAHQAHEQTAETHGTGVVSFEHPGAARLTVVFFSAALAISAMVLPGISGSFVLLLMGVYFDILAAINQRQVVVLAVFCAGLGIGLLLFARIMNLLLRRFHDVTMSFMIGLMAGSLYVLWPFKQVVTVGTEKVYLGNIMPSAWGGSEFIAIAAALAGAATVTAFYFPNHEEATEEQTDQ